MKTQENLIKSAQEMSKQWTVTPITADGIAIALSRLDSLVERMMAETGVPGVCVGVIHDGTIKYEKGFGVRDIRNPQNKIDPDTVFQIASVSKFVGAVAISKVVSDGLASWDDKIKKYMPNIQLSDPYVERNLTVGDLYSHRSGIPGEWGNHLESIGFTQQEIFNTLKYIKLNEPYRLTYSYSNFGMTLGAETVAKKIGMSWSELSEKFLYQPLGMNSTVSLFSKIPTQNLALMHVIHKGKWQPQYRRMADAQSAAGGVSSSVKDLLKLMKLVLDPNQQFIKKDVINQMFTPQVRTGKIAELKDRSNFYGYGINVSVDGSGRTRYTHNGAFFTGTATGVMMIPDAKLGIVVLTNGFPRGIPESIMNIFCDAVELYSRKEPTYSTNFTDWFTLYNSNYIKMLTNNSIVATNPKPQNAIMAHGPSYYIGKYYNQYYGEITISFSQGKYIMTYGRDRKEIIPYDKDTFSLYRCGSDEFVVDCKFDPTDYANMVAVNFTGNGVANTVQIEEFEKPYDVFERI